MVKSVGGQHSCRATPEMVPVAAWKMRPSGSTGGEISKRAAGGAGAGARRTVTGRAPSSNLRSTTGFRE